jgi:hypothetical protein
VVQNDTMGHTFVAGTTSPNDGRTTAHENDHLDKPFSRILR